MNKKELLNYLNSKKEEINDINLNIWNNPEIAGTEKKSANIYREALKKNGFKVVEVEGMDNAFYGEYGSGYPIIAFLGEYDALPGLSQKLESSFDPIEKGGPGHGCGHNLLGAASYGAILAIKEYIDKSGASGTIRYYGCPEEETLVGKGKMIKAGAFKDCDLALSWHPMSMNSAIYESFLAMNTMKFKFHGVSAHAALSPDSGRSALDAIELMNVGVNYMREHVTEKARIHYTITNAGGAPNIIPAEAESWYYVRAPKRKDVSDITERIFAAAKGAALMTGTTVEIEKLGGCYEQLPNEVLFDLTYKNMDEIDRPTYTKEELQFSKELQDTLDPKLLALEKKKFLGSDSIDAIIYDDLVNKEDSKKTFVASSSDSGDVSWNMPMNLFITSCWSLGIANHSWQATAGAGSSVATKGMMYASSIIAGVAYDLLNDTSIIEKAKEEFKDRTKKDKYVSPLDD